MAIIDNFQCGSAKCDAEADWRCAWPGQEIDLCSQCARRAIGIADVMGFVLPTQLLQPIKAMVAAIELANEDSYASYCPGCGEENCGGRCVHPH